MLKDFWKLYDGSIYEAVKKDCGPDFADGLRTITTAVTELIRRERNDASHPVPADFPRAKVHEYIVVAHSFLSDLYKFSEWFKTKQGQL